MADKPKELTPHDVREWFRNVATGEVHYTKILEGRIPPERYPNLRAMLSDMITAKDPIVESCGRNDGHYRAVQALPEPIIFGNVNRKEDSGVILPFDLRRYCFIPPNSLLVFAGSKSSGKTGLLYQTVTLNMNHLPTILLSNLEGGVSTMKDRFMHLGVDMENSEPPFLVYPAIEDHHHLMKRPDTLYVIDYIDVPEGGEFYLVASKISRIARKLKTLGNSVAIVGLQKPPGRDLAFGGANTLKDTNLYVAMDKGKLKIVDCKIPAGEFSPNNMTWKFKYLDAGTRFEEISREYVDDTAY